MIILKSAADIGVRQAAELAGVHYTSVYQWRNQPKGNGTDEGAFSQMKKALGSIRIKGLSANALAKSVLNALISVYIYMRNRLTLRNGKVLPIEQMAVPTSEDQRNFEREQLKQHNLARAGCKKDKIKLD